MINNQGRAFWYGPDGESRIFEAEEQVPKGWKDHPFAQEPIAAEGKEELAGLRAEYQRVMGKKPFGGWDADKLREKLAEA